MVNCFDFELALQRFGSRSTAFHTLHSLPIGPQTDPLIGPVAKVAVAGLAAADTRLRWGEFHGDYAVTVGRKGTLFLTCKNPVCRAELETAHEGIEGETITCPATEVTCPVCGTSFICG